MNQFTDETEQNHVSAEGNSDLGGGRGGTCSPSDGYKKLCHSWLDMWEEREVGVAARFRRPSPAAIKRMQAGAGKDAIKASYNLLLDCVHPEDKEKLAADLETYPAVVTTLSGVILKSCGVSADLGN